MRSPRRPLLLSLLALLSLAAPLRAKQGKPTLDSALHLDTSALLVRPLLNADSVIAAYKSQADFDYEREPDASNSLWHELGRWLSETFDMSPATEEAFGAFLEVLPYIVIAVAAVFIAVRLTGANFGGLFRRKGRNVHVGDAEEVEEKLETIDLEGRLAEAERAEDWQRAVRWRYLTALREMERRGLLQYRVDRTNHEYLRGLPQGELRDAFAGVTLLFEYAWYGRLPLDAAGYRRLRDAFVLYGARLEKLPVRAAQSGRWSGVKAEVAA